MKKLMKHKIFIVMFLLTYFSFFVITIFILDLKKDGLGVGYVDYGFPFAYYHTTCFSAYYSWFGLIGNMLVAIFLSVVIALISTHFWLKFLLPLWREISSPEFRSKWHI